MNARIPHHDLLTHPESLRVWIATEAAMACHAKVLPLMSAGHYLVGWSYLERAAEYVRIARTIARHNWTAS